MTTQTILLVDDRQENLIALEAILEAPDRVLVKAANGQEALAQALRHDLALILLDVQMPDMDGFEVAELLRRNVKTRQVPVIFCTAISKEKRYITRGYDVGAVDYLFKPIDPDLLVQKVRVFLELDRQKRQLQQTLLQLRRVQQENERLLKALGEGVVGIDRAGLVTFANPAASGLLGRDVQKLIGARVDELLFLDAGGKPAFRWEDSPVLSAVGRGEAWQSAELWCRPAGAAPAAIDMTITPINDRANTFAGAVAVVRPLNGKPREGAPERRRAPRKRLSADLTLFDRSTGANIGRLVNLSESGLRLSSKKPVQEGQRIAFSMVLPQQVRGSSTLSFDAIVVWCQQAGYGGDVTAGFRFAELKPEALEVVRYLLEKY